MTPELWAEAVRLGAERVGPPETFFFPDETVYDDTEYWRQAVREAKEKI